MKNRIIQSLLLGLSAIAMLLALVAAGRLVYRVVFREPQPLLPTEPTAQTLPPEVEETTAPAAAQSSQPGTEPATQETETALETVETAPPETETARVTIDTIPLYYQNDYPDDRYDKGTISDSGSGMTCLAMMLTYLTDHPYYPDQVADILAEYNGNTFGRMDYGSDLFQLPWRRASNFHDAKRALEEGKKVIAVMNSKSYFGPGYHFVVWTGFNEEGLVTVLDPERDNYDAWNLKEGFKTGFQDRKLITGFSGAWIYDKSEMPEEPVLLEPEPYAEVCRYGDLELTEQEMTLIAKLICAEGASEPFDGQQAIAEVILNRLVSAQFPSTVYNVIYAQGQFEGGRYLYKAEPTYTQYKAIERALLGPYVVPEDVVFFARFAVNDKIWGEIGEHVFCHSYTSE